MCSEVSSYDHLGNIKTQIYTTAFDSSKYVPILSTSASSLRQATTSEFAFTTTCFSSDQTLDSRFYDQWQRPDRQLIVLGGHADQGNEIRIRRRLISGYR